MLLGDIVLGHLWSLFSSGLPLLLSVLVRYIQGALRVCLYHCLPNRRICRRPSIFMVFVTSHQERLRSLKFFLAVSSVASSAAPRRLVLAVH